MHDKSASRLGIWPIEHESEHEAIKCFMQVLFFFQERWNGSEMTILNNNNSIELDGYVARVYRAVN